MSLLSRSRSSSVSTVLTRTGPDRKSPYSRSNVRPDVEDVRMSLEVVIRVQAPYSTLRLRHLASSSWSRRVIKSHFWTPFVVGRLTSLSCTTRPGLDHLPILGQAAEPSLCATGHVIYKPGDRVKVCVDIDTLEDMQKGHGGWHPLMSKVGLTCMCWKLTAKLAHKLETFQNKCLRKILGVFWPNTITNEELHRKTDATSLATQIKKRRWRWLGHVCRMSPGALPKTAYAGQQMEKGDVVAQKKHGDEQWRRR
ncbi:hypothetical protein LSAT2_004014 [Lamellibrachia satsuma]|nr:hypothetical protein LSAT2_004014 [Lamellibrachia satsuma]